MSEFTAGFLFGAPLWGSVGVLLYGLVRAAHRWDRERWERSTREHADSATSRRLEEEAASFSPAPPGVIYLPTEIRRRRHPNPSVRGRGA